MTTRTPKPRGKEQVMAAIMDAAEDLFARKGVAAVSIRDIAARAKVNHGLIHRHFGSKEKLRRMVQDRLAAKVREEIGSPRDYLNGAARGMAAIRKHPAFWRVLARTFLDDQFEGDVQSEFPFVRRQVELTVAAQAQGKLRNDLDPRLIVASGLAMGLGLMVFEKYILPGTGLDDQPPDQVADVIMAAWLEQIAEDDQDRSDNS